MRVSQKGFTLIELMIVVVIISILAVIAVPQYQNYINKAKFTEVITAVAPYKLAVELCSMDVGMEGIAECSSDKNGIPKAYTKADDDKSKSNVGSIIVEGGKITATAATTLGYKEMKPDYILEPRFTETALIWEASGSCQLAALC